MAKKKQEEAPKGSPAWMATFSDLMNLLLCFFVLLFSMSTVNAEKFEMVISSFKESFSVLPAGGSSISEGKLINSGISALEMFDVYVNASTAQKGEDENEQNVDESSADATAQAMEELEKQGLEQSETMAESIDQMINQYGLQDLVEVDFNAQYVLLTLNGSILFESGEYNVKSDAYRILDKLSLILNQYKSNMIEVDGHTDNVPIRSGKFEDNNVLSMYRAYSVATYIRNNTEIEPSHIVSAGRGEYVPIADNSTAEGRALNRRVEIKVFNTLNSEEAQ